MKKSIGLTVFGVCGILSCAAVWAAEQDEMSLVYKHYAEACTSLDSQAVEIEALLARKEAETGLQCSRKASFARNSRSLFAGTRKLEAHFQCRIDDQHYRFLNITVSENEKIADLEEVKSSKEALNPAEFTKPYDPKSGYSLLTIDLLPGNFVDADFSEREFAKAREQLQRFETARVPVPSEARIQEARLCTVYHVYQQRNPLRARQQYWTFTQVNGRFYSSRLNGFGPYEMTRESSEFKKDNGELIGSYFRGSSFGFGELHLREAPNGDYLVRVDNVWGRHAPEQQSSMVLVCPEPAK